MVMCQVRKEPTQSYPQFCWGTESSKICHHEINWSRIASIDDARNFTWTYGDGVFYSFPNSSWENSIIGNTSLYFSSLFLLNSTTFHHLVPVSQSPIPTEETSKNFLIHFNQFYQQYHGYASFLVCLFGIAANLINITVLTRRNMTSPTNFILTALAVSDLMTMISYLPYAVYFHFVSAPDKSLIHPEGWVVYMLFHTLFIITTHTISMWLTVTLALFRYVVVCHPIHGPGMCSLLRAKQSIVVIVLITIISCSPNYIMYHTCQQESGGYWFETNYFVVEAHKIFNFWMFGVVLKVVPCILLTVLSALLLRAMAAQNAKRKLLLQKKTRVSINKATGNYKKCDDNPDPQIKEDALLGLKNIQEGPSRTEAIDKSEAKDTTTLTTSTATTQPVSIEQETTKPHTDHDASLMEKAQNQPVKIAEDNQKSSKSSSRKTKEQRKFFQSTAAQERDRTTCMLVVVVLCFVIIELPQGILTLMSAVNDRIFDEVYVPLGDFLDILVLINSSVNFILYCTMSAKFRSTFQEIFIRKWLKR